MNSVHITGRLTRDPELRFTPSGKAVANFSIAVNYRGSDDASFFDIVAWEKTAEVVSEHLRQGRRVLIDGYLSQRKWDTPEGEHRQKVEIVAQQVEFLDYPKDQTAQPPDQDDERL